MYFKFTKHLMRETEDIFFFIKKDDVWFIGRIFSFVGKVLELGTGPY